MFETDWRRVITEPSQRKLFEALEDPKWEWRTLAALSHASGLPEAEVRQVLHTHPGLVRKSIVLSATGEELYTLQRRFFERQSLFDKIRISLSTSSTSTST
jgi:hypothetical protein